MYFVCTWWIFFLHSLDVIAKWYTKVFYLILSQQHENEINEAPSVIKNCTWSIKMPWLITLTAMGQNNDKQTLWYTFHNKQYQSLQLSKKWLFSQQQGAKKIVFTACHSGKLKPAFTSPDVISTSPKNFLTTTISGIWIPQKTSLAHRAR